MSAATSSAAIGSARSKPAVRITTPAIAVAANAYESVRRCWNEPSMFIDARLALRELRVANEVDDDADERDDDHRPAARDRAA